MNLNKFLKNYLYTSPECGDVCAKFIRNEIENNHPSMIARFGSVEIKGVLYPKMPWLIRKLTGNHIFSSMKNNAGFFSISDYEINKFSELMIRDMTLLDILGSWRIEEKFLIKNFQSAKRVELKSLEPYLSKNPWTETLEGLKILVVHPFSTTIEHQYNEKREFLFSDKRILPKFKSLETVKAVQTIAGNQNNFENWFQALDYMKDSIDSKDYDVAILGCGAYGFPLAAHIKRTGKKAIHLGGATQILFGIKGKRWDNHPIISSFYNDYWVRPKAEDIPLNSIKVEDGCYW
jgi:hypothetical protein